VTLIVPSSGIWMRPATSPALERLTGRRVPFHRRARGAGETCQCFLPLRFEIGSPHRFVRG
jgi:hypothetical protein